MGVPRAQLRFDLNVPLMPLNCNGRASRADKPEPSTNVEQVERGLLGGSIQGHPELVALEEIRVDGSREMRERASYDNTAFDAGSARGAEDDALGCRSVRRPV